MKALRAAALVIHDMRGIVRLLARWAKDSFRVLLLRLWLRSRH